MTKQTEPSLQAETAWLRPFLQPGKALWTVNRLFRRNLAQPDFIDVYAPSALIILNTLLDNAGCRRIDISQSGVKPHALQKNHPEKGIRYVETPTFFSRVSNEINQMLNRLKKNPGNIAGIARSVI